MSNLPHDLYTAEQTRELERIVMEEQAISSATLMSRAGTATLEAIRTHCPLARHILIVCGAGNNGGDGFELARQALANDYRISVFQLGDERGMSDETTAARQALLATGTEIQAFTDSLSNADIIVDALFGIGLNREVSGDYALAIDAINQQSKSTPVLALDIPSGIHADSGQALCKPVRASITLSFLGLNTGLFTGDGPSFCGKVIFDSLNVPFSIYSVLTPAARRISLEHFGTALAPRERTAHKGLYGHLLIIGGDHGMSGAARMAAEAGGRVGAGLISVATRRAHSAFFNLTRPELMCHGVEDVGEMEVLLSSANALVVGPGLGQSEWGAALFQKTLEANKPMVVDADALNLLSKNPQHRDNWVLTPHPGEAARLLGCSSKDIQSDRFAAVDELQKRYGGVVVLKGSGTLISNGEAPIRLSTAGNPGMASGGMGDVLTGVIGGLLAQHFPIMDAACVGVTLQGMAADKTAEQDGERGTLAMDLMPHLRKLANLDY